MATMEGGNGGGGGRPAVAVVIYGGWLWVMIGIF